MRRPKTTEERSSVLLSTVGGAVGLVMSTAVFELGQARVEPWRLLGGIVFSGEIAAKWVGYVVQAIWTIAIVPPIFAMALWPRLPGPPRSIAGALARGVAITVALWILDGVLLPVFGALDRSQAGNPGFFAASAGAFWIFLAAHAAYGVPLAALCYLAQGLEPVDTFGWIGVGKRGPRDEPSG